jgi:CRP/FNR family transcriptional regulator, cyclic AMP receptor protein
LVSTLEAARKLMSGRGWLSQTPPSFGQSVLTRCLLQKFDAGATIYGSGDPPGGMYGLVSGAFSVSVVQGERGPYFAHFFGPGDWFGEGPAISGRTRIVGLSAVRETEVLYLSLRSVDEILREQPASWRFFAALTLGKLEVAMWAIDDLMMRDSFKRFVAVLLRLGGCRAATPPGEVPTVVHVSQEDLAAMANVSRSTANAILGRLEAEGHVRQSYRQIGIVSPDVLRSMLVE